MASAHRKRELFPSCVGFKILASPRPPQLRPRYIIRPEYDNSLDDVPLVKRFLDNVIYRFVCFCAAGCLQLLWVSRVAIQGCRSSLAGLSSAFFVHEMSSSLTPPPRGSNAVVEAPRRGGACVVSYRSRRPANQTADGSSSTTL